MSERFFSKTMRIAVPIALQAMLQSSFSVIDQLMVGQLGKTSIAAVEVGGKPGFVFIFVSGAIATVAGIMVSQYMGKKEPAKINSSMSVNMCVMLALSIVTAVLCMIFPQQLASIFTKDSAVIGNAIAYIRTTAMIYPLSGTALILAVHIRCNNKAEYPLYISAVSAVMNTILNYALIFGRFGAPALGVEGAAIASVISQVVNLLLMIYFYRKLCTFKFNLCLTREDLMQYVFMLMPLAFNEFLWTCGQNVNTYVYGHMGTSELVAMSLTGPVQSLFMGAMSGLQQAASILIGRSLGEKDYDSAYNNAKKFCWYGFAGSCVLSVLLLLAAYPYVGFYNVDSSVKILGAQLLMAFALLAPIKVQNMIFSGGVIKSGGKTKYVVIIDFIGTWLVGAPLVIFLGLVVKVPIVWTYVIFSQEELVRFLLTVWLFKRRKWMRTLE